MSSIGITNWRDSRSGYPLKNARELTGFVSDASFIVFDDFVPSIESITITDTHMVIELKLDDGLLNVSLLRSDITNGLKVEIRKTNRYYGVMILGERAVDISNLVYGDVIEMSVKFDRSVLRVINSKNGVYSINGLRGDVLVDTGEDIYRTGNALNAVSMPNAVQHAQLQLDSLTLITTNNSAYSIELISHDIAPTDAVLSPLTISFDRTYTGIAQDDTRLIGAFTDDGAQSLYTLNTIPAPILATFNNFYATSLTRTDNGKLYGFASDGKVFNFDAYPYSSAVSSNCGQLGATIFSINNDVFMIQDGQENYDGVNQHSSSRIYKLTISGSTSSATTVGLVADYSLTYPNQLPWIKFAAVVNDLIYALCRVNDEYWLYEIEPLTYHASKIATIARSSLDGDIASIFVSNLSITTDPVTPLASINGLTTSSNRLNFVGSETISVSAKTNNTLNIGLRIPDETLNVKRTVHYE